MMNNKIDLSKFKNLDTNSNELNNPSFNQKIEEKLTNEELWKITRSHLKRIIWLEWKIKLIQQENKDLKNELLENTKILNETKKEFLSNKKWFKWFIWIFIIVFAGWCIETFYRFHNVKEDYITQTKELEKQIELFKKEQENLKEDNKSLKENLKNEIEKEIYKTILKKN